MKNQIIHQAQHTLRITRIVVLSILSILGLQHSLSAQRSPVLYTQLAIGSGSSQNPYYKAYNAEGNSELSFGVGLGVRYEPVDDRGVYFSIGGDYRTFGHDFVSQYLNYEDDFEHLYEKSSSSSFRYLGIPMSVGYKFTDRLWTPYVQFTFTPSFLTSFTRFTVANQSSFISVTEDIRDGEYHTVWKYPPSSTEHEHRGGFSGGKIYKGFNLFVAPTVGMQGVISERLSVYGQLTYGYGMISLENKNCMSSTAEYVLTIDGIEQNYWENRQYDKHNETLYIIDSDHLGDSDYIVELSPNPFETKISYFSFETGLLIKF